MSIQSVQVKLKNARDAESKHLFEEAMQHFLSAADELLRMVKSEPDPQLKINLREKCVQVISYCEDIKKLLPPKLAPAVIDKTFRYSDIIGLDDVKQVLRECTTLLDQHPELFKGVSPSTRILLYGPPGTGKSMLARAMASESGRQFLAVSSADVMSKWQGESEKNIRNLFDQARLAPTIVFFDEIDGFCSNRTDNETEGSKRVKAELLVQLEGVKTSKNTDLIVLAATNTPWSLDPAFRRRFEQRIYIPLPDKECRSKLIMFYLPMLEVDLFTLDRLADSLNLCSSSDIANLCNEAKMIPIRKVQQATRFKVINNMYHVYESDQEEETDDSDDDLNKIAPVIEEAKFSSFPPGTLVPPTLTADDLAKLIQKHKPSITQLDIDRYMTWESTT